MRIQQNHNRSSLEVTADVGGVEIEVSSYGGNFHAPAEYASINLTHEQARQLRDYLLSLDI